MLGRQPWSFAGDSGRASVSQLFLDPCIHYNLDTDWFLLTYMLLTANWQADSSNRWTVPLGGGVGKLFTIGSQAINYARKPTTMSRGRIPHRIGSGALRFSFCFPNRIASRF